ncbi:MAG: hypothetical protein AB4062_06455 [Crocosphaera sp.]
MAWWKYTRGRFTTSDFDTQDYGSHGNDEVGPTRNAFWLVPPGQGRNYLEGNRGSDILNGWGGNDILVGVDPDYYGAGSGEYDRLWGGSGSDYFVLGDAYETYYQGNGYAIIEDFAQGFDKLVVNGSASDYRYSTTSVSGIGSSAQDTVLETTDGDWIAVFEDTTFSPLYSSDFIGLA